MDMHQPETTLDKVERFMNDLTDKDFGWYPFVFLRPQPHEFMDTKFLAKISLYYGPLTGIVMYLGVFLGAGDIPFNLLAALICIIAGIPIFFITYRFTFAIPWNRRAERLTKTKSKRQEKAF